MANNADRGRNTGKQRRAPMPKKAIADAVADDEPSNSQGPGVITWIHGKNLVCNLGHEMAKGLNRSLTLDDCVGNLYSPVDSVCRKCGICRHYVATYGQARSSVGHVVKDLLYPTKRMLSVNSHL